MLTTIFVSFLILLVSHFSFVFYLYHAKETTSASNENKIDDITMQKWYKDMVLTLQAYSIEQKPDHQDQTNAINPEIKTSANHKSDKENQTRKDEPSLSHNQTKESSNKESKEQVTYEEKKHEPDIYISSSLTASTGSVYLSGKAKGYHVMIDEQVIQKKDDYFSTSAGSSFTIQFYSELTNKTIKVNSPAASTNLILQSLILTIDPLHLSATLQGKVSLKLPGKISGDFINISNGTSSSTILENGYFSLSIPLSYGKNQLTATGRWLTIAMDLPMIEVVLTE